MAVTRLLSFALLVVAFPAAAEIFTVGPGGTGAGCTTNSIQLAIDAASDGYTIRIVSGSYTNQALKVNGKDLTLSGGYADCAAATASGLSTLSGLGGANDSVVQIRGSSNVTLEDLLIIRGDEVSDGYGGGVDYKGTGSLVLVNTALAQNYAGYGGGMSVISEGGAVTVNMLPGAVVQLNTAQFSGGGIRLEGNVFLSMISPDTTILLNEARGINPGNNQPQYGNGGGLQVIAPARADIGSPGFGGSGAIANNTARYGGGIAIDGAEDTDAEAFVRVFTTDPARPTRIHGNRATQTGGGVHLLPVYTRDLTEFFPSEAVLCLWDARIDDNRAQNGAAIYGDTELVTFGISLGSTLFINRQDPGRCAGRPGGVGAATCATLPCTTMSGNRTVNAQDQPSDGAVVLLQDIANFRIGSVWFSDNVATEIVRLIEPAEYEIEQMIAVRNTLSGRVLRVEGDTFIPFTFRDSTIADNVMASSPVISFDGDVSLQRLLVSQPGRTVLSVGGSRNVVDVIAHEVASLGGGPLAIVAAPRFTDPAHSDYLPIAASAAVDFATSTGVPALDAFGAQRDVDLPVKADTRGTRDVGALERQNVGNLVLNPDFPARSDSPPDIFRLWTQPGGPAAVTWNATQGAPNGAGSVFVAYQPPPGGTGSPDGGPPAYTGLRQCVLLPGPGVYALSGWSLVPGNGQNRDYARLHWVLRNASADCTGAIAAEGDHFLPRSGTWSGSTPVEIPLAPGAWTINSSLEVTMEILDGDVVGTNLVDAYFDRIELRVVALEVDDIFEDGFE